MVGIMDETQFATLQEVPGRKKHNWDLIEEGTIHTSKSVAEIVGCDDATASYWLYTNSSEKRRYFDTGTKRYVNVYKVARKIK